MLSLCRDILYSSPTVRSISFKCRKALGFYSNMDEITEFLYISGVVAATDENLEKFGIYSIVDASSSTAKDRVVKEGVDRITVEVDDHESATIKPYFDVISDKIKENKEKNVKTLVHCFAGVSRSATLCIVYFVKHENLTLKEAYNVVKSKRGVISPNITFWREMIEYENELLGSTSVKIVKRNFAEVPDVY